MAKVKQVEEWYASEQEKQTVMKKCTLDMEVYLKKLHKDTGLLWPRDSYEITRLPDYQVVRQAKAKASLRPAHPDKEVI